MYRPPRRRIDIPQTERKPRPQASFLPGALVFLQRNARNRDFRSAAQNRIARGAGCSAPQWSCHAVLIFLIVEDAGFLNIDCDEASSEKGRSRRLWIESRHINSSQPEAIDRRRKWVRGC
jgi:hypothetical protein